MKLRDSDEIRNMRNRLFNLVDHGLPRLIAIPPLQSIRQEEWFRKSGLEKRLKVFAFPAFQIGVFSGKMMPALRLWLSFEQEGLLNESIEGLCATSGNYGKDAAYLAPLFGIHGFTAVVNDDTPAGKLAQLRAAGASVLTAPKQTPSTDYAYELAKSDKYILLDQYVRDESISGHEWTMSHIKREMENLRVGAKAFRGQGFIFCAVCGTCSTLIAADRYLKRPSTDRQIQILGVASISKAERVPGSRAPEDLSDLRRIGGLASSEEFRNALDFDLVADVDKHSAYRFNVERIRQIQLPVGPTGALLEAGLFRLVRQKLESGRIGDLTNESGEIVAVLMWVDSYLAYLDDHEYLKHFLAR